MARLTRRHSEVKLPEGRDKRERFLGVAVRGTSQSGEAGSQVPVRPCLFLRRALSAGQLARPWTVWRRKRSFSCDTELDRWSVLGFFCAKLFFSFSELPFELRSLAFNVSAEIDCMGFCRRSEERSGNASKFSHLWRDGRRGRLVPALP